MKGLISKHDFELVKNPEDAFVIIINICTVKGNKNSLKKIRKLHENYPDKKYIIAGCITKNIIPEIKEIIKEPSLISTHNIKEIISVIEETINENPIEITEKNQDEKINLPKVRKNKIIGIIPISQGCLGYCAYCSVKLIKGDLRSYPIESIIKEIKTALNQGCKEIWITSQDTGAYGRDININLIGLIEEITNIEADFIVRLGMMNPNHVLEMLDDLIEIYKNKKIFKFLHIPVQSGNNKILRLMKRKYKVDDFKRIVEKFRKEIEDITISTDIITGFPSETDEQFKDSLTLIDDIKPDVLNISRFNARPGTDAFKMEEQIKGEVPKDRSRKLTSNFEWIAFRKNKKWDNWKGTILINEKGKNNTFVGRNSSYKPVVVKGNFKLGEKIQVKIVNTTKHYLVGEKI